MSTTDIIKNKDELILHIKNLLTFDKESSVTNDTFLHSVDILEHFCSKEYHISISIVNCFLIFDIKKNNLNVICNINDDFAIFKYSGEKEPRGVFKIRNKKSCFDIAEKIKELFREREPFLKYVDIFEDFDFISICSTLSMNSCKLHLKTVKWLDSKGLICNIQHTEEELEIINSCLDSKVLDYILNIKKE